MAHRSLAHLVMAVFLCLWLAACYTTKQGLGQLSLLAKRKPISEVLEDGGKAFNNEVIRVLKKMPVWVPGKNAGEHVSVYYTIPVKFM